MSSLHARPVDASSTFFFRRAIREIGRVLNVGGTTSAIIKARNSTYRRNPGAYVNLLFSEARIAELLVDTGYPSEFSSGYSVNMKTFQKLVPCRIRLIHRVDDGIIHSLSVARSLDEATEVVLDEIGNSVKKQRAVSLKSTVAYLTGLEIKHVARQTAGAAFKSLSLAAKSGKLRREVLVQSGGATKALWDYFLLLAAERAGELGVPLQLHTGMGDAPMSLPSSNPALLHEFINSVECQNTKIVLVHSGYPFVREAGYLANAYPNVYVDLSLMIPFVGAGVTENLQRLLELSPTTKLMYGSDGAEIPEVFWMAALETKRALAQILNRFIADDSIDDDEAIKIGKQVLRENARRVYNIKD